MTSAARPSRLDREALAAMIATGERWVAEQEAARARRRAEHGSLAEQVHEREADVQQVHILLAYLRTKVDGA